MKRSAPLTLAHLVCSCVAFSQLSDIKLSVQRFCQTDPIRRLKDRRGKRVDCPCVFQLPAQSTRWCDQRYEMQRTPSVIENGCTARPWIFPGAGENTCSFMFAPTFHRSTAVWLETNATHVNRIIFFKLKGRTVSHTFRPRWRCVRQPWPAGEDLPAESLLPEAQRRRSRVHGDQTFLDLRLKLFRSFLPLWCHLWIPSFVSICFCLFWVFLLPPKLFDASPSDSLFWFKDSVTQLVVHSTTSSPAEFDIGAFRALVRVTPATFLPSNSRETGR